MIHIVKSFSIVNKAEVDVFLEFFCFFYDPKDVGNLISCSSAFPAFTSESSWFTYHWSVTWRTLNITLLASDMSTIIWTLFGVALLWDWNKNRPFPVLWPLLHFPNLLARWLQHFNICVYIVKESESEAQSCPTLWDPVDYSLPCSSLHGILQERILEWVAISFSRGPSRPRDRTWVSRIEGRCFNLWATVKYGCGSSQNILILSAKYNISRDVFIPVTIQ